MPLRITKATDTIEVKTVVACIYAIPGIGKSTLGFAADKPLLIDFDRGSYRAGNRGDTVLVSSWADVVNIKADDLAGYKTIVVDTAGRALDTLTVDIINENPKLGRGGALTLQGFGALKTRFIAWLNLIRSFGLDVVLISHSDEQRNGDDLIERLDVQGGSRGEIYKSADVMGRLYITQGKRMLSFDPTDTAFGKNPASLPPLEVPGFKEKPTFLGDVLARIKAELNRQTAEQQEIAKLLGEWNAKIGEAAALEQFNGALEQFNVLVPQMAQIDARVRDNVKRLLNKTAKSKGFEFDKNTGAYVVKPEKPTETKQEEAAGEPIKAAA